MAAITPIDSTGGLGLITLRSVTAQASTGQTDWVVVPDAATYCTVFLNLTAMAGTSPNLQPSFLAADPVAKDDSYFINIAEHAALTAITAANQYVYQIGPGVTGIADDVTESATAKSFVSLNAVLPTLMGFKILNSRTNGNETYSYNLSCQFRRR